MPRMDDPLESDREQRVRESEAAAEDLSRHRLEGRPKRPPWSALRRFCVAWIVLIAGGIIATAVGGAWQPAFVTIVWGWIPAGIFAAGGLPNKRTKR